MLPENFGIIIYDVFFFLESVITIFKINGTMNYFDDTKWYNISDANDSLGKHSYLVYYHFNKLKIGNK